MIEALGLGRRRGLLPEIVDGSEVTHPLTQRAAEETGLKAGTPVSLGYVDMVMTALGAGVHTGDAQSGLHRHRLDRRASARRSGSSEVTLNAEGTGYVMALPVPGHVTQMQTNMAAALNIDWALRVAADLMAGMGQTVAFSDLVSHIEPLAGGVAAGGGALSSLHLRGRRARAVRQRAGAGGVHRAFERPPVSDLVRAVVEGLGFAARDCYAAMGELPRELRLTGGAARSTALRAILAGAVQAPVRVSAREEAGAAGAAMMAAVALGAFPTMDACIARWVTPLLGPAEAPDPELVRIYDRLFPAYVGARGALAPVWEALAGREGSMADTERSVA